MQKLETVHSSDYLNYETHPKNSVQFYVNEVIIPPLKDHSNSELASVLQDVKLSLLFTSVGFVLLLCLFNVILCLLSFILSIVRDLYFENLYWYWALSFWSFLPFHLINLFFLFLFVFLSLVSNHFPNLLLR